MNQAADTPWHELSPERAAELLDANPAHGLKQEAAARRLEERGPNRLTAKKGKGPIALFISQFHDPLIYILLASGFITGMLKTWVDASVIFGVVLLNAVIGFVQEMNALRAIDALARGLSLSVAVLRDGHRKVIPGEELVPGDLVFLQSGDKVPADLRLLRIRELQIDESALTGESVPVEKRIEPLPADTVLGDRANMAYSSTLVTYGTAMGLVVETGDATEIGRINRMLSEVRQLETPLTRNIAHFSRLLMWFIVALAAAAFAAGWLRGDDPVDTFVASVALAVAAIPEGLPVAVTITLAIGVRRMAKRNAIIRKLPAVETLGSTSIICSDKTGTLTQNQMTVQTVWAGGECFEVSGTGYGPGGEFRRENGDAVIPARSNALLECLKAGLLCNDARLAEEDGQWYVEGDPTEGALLVSARKADLDHADTADAHPRIDAIPFESAYQFMATLHHNLALDVRHVYLKGSAESLLPRCHEILGADGGAGPIDAAAVQSMVKGLASRGLRVLAFARAERSPEDGSVDHDGVKSGLTFLGLQGMIDPPRMEAVRAVAACRAAGIRVKMITGDHLDTAVAIAGQIGLDDSGRLQAQDGRALAALTDEQLPAAADATAVFARVAPEQKLRLVKALQSRGQVVAMTGDGVNDAPALRQADIGVAMGITGTEVSKEAAAMVLTDDNFASIAAAVEEGRGVYDNLVKFLTWTLPTNIGQGLVILLAVVLDMTLPILPGQILWINMTTAVFLGLTLAFETKEPGLMNRQPRRIDEPILTGQLLFRTLFVGLLLTAASFGLFQLELADGEPVEKARTAAVNMFAVGQTFYLFNCRSLSDSMLKMGLFSNLWLWGGIGIMAAAQLAFTYAPPLNWLFHTSPIGGEEWLLSAVAGVIIYLMVGYEKFLRKMRAESLGLNRSEL